MITFANSLDPDHDLQNVVEKINYDSATVNYEKLLSPSIDHSLYDSNFN